MPEVSVVIPSYNSSRFLGQALDSVLAQTFRDYEVIVVDDGSSDDTSEVLRRYANAVRSLHQPNQGVAVARNNGIVASAGRYVALLDADDTWLPSKLALQLDALRARPGSRACTTEHQLVDVDLHEIGDVKPRRSGISLETLLLEGNVLGCPSSMLCERELLLSTGGFDPDQSQCADWDMWLRLLRVADVVKLPEPLVNYRWHGSNMSSRPELLERDSVRVLQKAFDSGLPPAVARRRRRAFANNYAVLAGCYFQARRWREFGRCSARALLLDPRTAGRFLGFPLRAARRLSRRPRAAPGSAS
jgi:glycosyltransferase involved in cell wall biosynthesis